MKIETKVKMCGGEADYVTEINFLESGKQRNSIKVPKPKMSWSDRTVKVKTRWILFLCVMTAMTNYCKHINLIVRLDVLFLVHTGCRPAAVKSSNQVCAENTLDKSTS